MAKAFSTLKRGCRTITPRQPLRIVNQSRLAVRKRPLEGHYSDHWHSPTSSRRYSRPSLPIRKRFSQNATASSAGRLTARRRSAQLLLDSAAYRPDIFNYYRDFSKIIAIVRRLQTPCKLFDEAPKYLGIASHQTASTADTLIWYRQREPRSVPWHPRPHSRRCYRRHRPVSASFMAERISGAARQQ